jgi:NAD(P)-dependent dehydrogenase (short-subunit alcohol dehydrogenase family)
MVTMSSSLSLAGQVAVITGASRGIGREVAVHLSGLGADVAGFVRTPMTELLAWSDQGRTWLPGFGQGVEHRWGDGRSAAELVEAIAGGGADELTGRVLWAGDDLDELASRCRADPDYRRLRLIRD